MKNEKKTVIEIVNEKILEKLSQGVNPWRKTWKFSGGNFTNQPMNYASNKPYRGINCALLEPGYYVTYLQAQQLGGRVKKGAEGQMVVYWKFNVLTETDTNGIETAKQVPLLRHSTVFALEDTEGCREIKNRNVVQIPEMMTSAEVDTIINDYAARADLSLVITNTDQPLYNAARHQVIIPKAVRYDLLSEYYASVFHELAHSTGHKELLNRDFNGGFGSSQYAKEELIAEITSAYMLNHCNIAEEATTENQVAYLKNWAEHLKGNTANYFIISATKQAEKAYHLLINHTPEEIGTGQH